MPAPPALRRLLLPALLSAGCAAAPPAPLLVHPLDRPVTARLVAVYPFAFRWEEPPSRSLLLGMTAADALVDTGRLLVLGPSEFTVLRHESADPRTSTDLVAVLARRGLPGTGFVALRAWADRRVVRSASAVDGAAGLRHTEEVTYLERLELLDGDGGGVLLALTGEATRDPAAPDDADPTPELTRLHRDLLARAWRLLEPRLAAPAPPPQPVAVRWLPAAALTWAPPGVPSLADRLARGDALDAEVRRLAVYRFVDPAGDDARVAQALRLPGGLLVERVEGPWGEVLRAGDVVLSADGEPATGRQVLLRVAALARSGLVELQVHRGGATFPATVRLR